MLGVAEGTCKAQLHRARRLLRERLGLETVA
jgi:DNA-directed RNA polymerase specialized sigma24 family protein